MYLMDRLFFEVRLCIEVSKFNEFPNSRPTKTFKAPPSLTHAHFVKGQNNGHDKSPRNLLFGKTIQIESIHLEDIWKTQFCQHEHDIWWTLTYKNDLFAAHLNGRTVHMNAF